MKLKKILALAVCLAMVLSVVPAFGLTASAAEETVLFDVSTFGDAQYQNNGDATGIDQFGWTGSGAVNFNKNWTDGTWGSLSDQTPALMFFRSNKRGENGDEFPEATINNANDTMGAEKLVISFDYAAQDSSNLYQEWLFKDLAGNTFARIFSDIGDGATGDINNAEMHFGFQDGETAPYQYIERATDSRAKIQAMRGKNITITVEKASEGYSVLYGVEGEDTVYTQAVEAVNGFKSIASSVYVWNNQYAAMGLQNLKITYVPNTTLVEVTVTYKVGDVVVATETGKYDSSTSAGLALPEKYVLYDGEVYRADAVTATGNMEIPMTVVPRYASKEVDEEFTLNNKYTVTGGSIVVNGDFKAGTAGWTNRSLNTEVTEKTVAYDEAIGANSMQGKTGGAGDANSIGTEWTVEVGKTYYASMMVKTAGIDANNHRFNRLVNMPKDTAFNEDVNAELDADIIRFGKEVPKDNTWKKFEAVFTATNEKVTLLSSWVNDISFANIEILPVEMTAEGTPAKVTITAGENVYTAYEGYVFADEPVTAPIAAQKFAAGGKLYSIEAQDVALTTEKPEVNLTAEVIGENVAKSVTTTTGSATRWPTDNDYLTAVGGDDKQTNIVDDDGVAIATGAYQRYGTERRLTVVFDKPTLEDNQEAVLHLAVGGVRRNNSAGESATFRAQLNAGGKSAYTTGITDYNNGTVVSEYLTANITDLVKAATGEEISIEVASVGAICLVDEVQSGFNGANAGFASYIEVVDAVSVDVSMLEATKITKNGSLVQSNAEVAMMAAGDDVVYAAPGDVIRAYTDTVASSLVGDENDQYYPVLDGAAVIAVKEADITLTEEAELNVTMYDGAQVRVGSAYNEADGTVNLEGANSGLRFVALVDKTSGAAASADEFGVSITAENSSVEVLIPADKFQDDEETIFTAVLTNLKKSNYNRKFTAKPYAKFGDEIVYGDTSVERSIYEVSAGLLLEGVTVIEGLESYELSDAVAAVLNAYVNNVGIRLDKDGDVFSPSSDKYTGEVLFTVTSDVATNETGKVYTITVTPVETKGADYVIDKDLFLENVRINNNNASVVENIDSVTIDEATGALTFTFTVPAAAEQQPTEPAEG